MKLSGNKRNGRYASSNERSIAPQASRKQEEQYVGPRAAKTALKKKKLRRTRRILTGILIIIVALSAVLFAVYEFGITPPPVKPRPSNSADPSDGAGVSAGTAPGAVSSDRNPNQYTFLVLGVSGGNSDTMMVANLDTDTHKLNVVSIPRDTLVNVSWNTKKVNSIYPNKGVDGVLEGVSDILGFPVDFYVLVDLEAFIELVDAVGGVNFDVPVNMDYDDDPGNLHIHFKKGLQLLNGQEAMEVVRFRHGYADQDIGRISTQQDFLATAADQILKQQKEINLTELISIFLKYVTTDLNAPNLVWLGKEFYKLNSTDITFNTLPANYGDYVNKQSYVTIYVNDWLEILNEKINPFIEDFTAKDLSILTRDSNGSLYVTNGVYAGKQSWGTSASSSSSGSSTTADASAKPSASPSPSPSASPSPSPSPSASPSPSPDPSASPSPSPDPSPSPSPSDIPPSPSEDPSPSPCPSPSSP